MFHADVQWVGPFTSLAFVLVALGCSEPTTTTCPEPAAVTPTPVVDIAPVVPVTVTTVMAVVIEQINAGDADAMFASFAPAMQQAVPLEVLRGMLPAIVDQRGPLTGATPIEVSERHGTFEVAAERGAWKVQIVLDEADAIAGLGFDEPESAAPPLARSAPAGLPVRGEWLVFWGGDRREINHHVDARSQRRAADLVMVDADGKTHRGEGRELADYYAYGQDILAMADGVVVTVVDGVHDNVPGELDPTFVPGNIVTLRHEGEVHSVYAHLVPGSIRVKVGERVRRGQRLGKCGNSGNSSEPHLHVQYQDGPRFDTSWGVEPVFDEVVLVRDGASTVAKDYVFLKGDRISAKPAAKR